MSENTISPISSIRPAEAGTPPRVESAAPAKAVTIHKPDILAQGQAARQKESASVLARDLSAVTIHFRVDEETNDVTVYVVDRKSRRVLRSIPANELHKLKAGDLLKLTA